MPALFLFIHTFKHYVDKCAGLVDIRVKLLKTGWLFGLFGWENMRKNPDIFCISCATIVVNFGEVWGVVPSCGYIKGKAS